MTSGMLRAAGDLWTLRGDCFWGGCTVENLHGKALWLQAIQDSVENIMEKREERADSGEDAECRIERESAEQIYVCACVPLSVTYISRKHSLYCMKAKMKSFLTCNHN